MDRQRIFRGRDISGKWHYGYLFQGKTDNDIDYSVILTQKRDCTDDRLPEDMPFAFYKDEVFVVDPNTVGQCTGKIDKNKNKIYNGDLLRDKYGAIYEIWYSEDTAAFYGRNSETI